MENLKKRFCRLCSNSNAKNLKEIDARTRDALKSIVLRLNLLAGGKHLICDDCSTKLHAAFKFKSRCISVDASVNFCIDLKNESPTKLSEVGSKRYSMKSDVWKLCRLCYRSGKGFTSVHEIGTGLFQRCIPEVNFRVNEDPVICKLCLDSLIAHNSFIKNCLNVDSNIEDLLKEKDLHIKSENNEQEENKQFVLLEIKEIERNLVEFENVQELVETEEIYIKSEYDIGDESFDSSYSCYNAKLPCSSNKHSTNDNDPSEVQWHECDTCSFKSKHKFSLNRHSAKHKDPCKVRWFVCDQCSYKSNDKDAMRKHSRIHKDPSKIRWYKCDKCSYKSITKTNLKRHLTLHKDPSIIQWHECDRCSFKSKSQSGLIQHSMIHKDPCDRKWYECDKCGYKLKTKSGLNYHLKKHGTVRPIEIK